MTPPTAPINIASGTKIIPNTYIHSPVNIDPFCLLENCEIGAFSYCGRLSEICYVRIGRYCQIARDVLFLKTHPLDRLTTHPFSYSDMFPAPHRGSEKAAFPAPKVTSVGNDVWIGAGARIIGGVSIGDGAVIGAGSVVTKDIPPYTIAAGNPARVIRLRFPEELIADILATAWWRYDLTSVNLSWDSPEQTLGEIKHLISEKKITPYESPVAFFGQETVF
jgi:acetyltransferase-like isoleucine patch superfamily enzyme